MYLDLAIDKYILMNENEKQLFLLIDFVSFIYRKYAFRLNV